MTNKKTAPPKAATEPGKAAEGAAAEPDSSLVEAPEPEPAAASAPAVELATPPKVETAGARFPIVGIGASAGGLAAFEAFFSGMPASADPAMAFVLVQHLAPDHKSILSDLIRRYTRMQVFEVEDGMVVQPNCAYIIPPNCDMAFLNGALELLEPAAPRGQRLPIDFFFRSLAQDQRERAIGIVLSCTGSDGTLGVRAIKGEGGMVMAQNTASSEFDGMPRSAIATGLVDYELPPAEMPAQLIAYAAHAFGKLPLPVALPAPATEIALKKIFVLLRAQVGHDFSQYKPSTVHRRIERRLAVHQIASIDDYVGYLQQTPAEVEALFRDLLIGVTNFFRDPEAFQVLEERVIPLLFAGKPPGSTVRVWTTGCSTGEEAYSLAILLVEHMEALKASYTIQLFATDIDSQAIATARAGVYPATIAADVSSERLARFFTLDAGDSAYRVNKGIRDLLVFSEQDVIKDPPFSRLDLISCRNLLIYMGAELQKRLIPLFHYALKPEGMLFLGTSEGDRVGVPWLYSACGHCEFCLAAQEPVCGEAQFGGYTKNGGFAEYIVADPNYVAHIPAGLAARDAAPLICAGITSYKGLKETQVRPGQWVVVSGIGGLGHLGVQYAKAMGLQVCAVDIDEGKLEHARRLGADAVVNARSGDPVEAVRKVTAGGAHGVLITAPSLAAFKQGIGMTRKHGTCVLVGIPPGEFPTPLFDVVANCITIRGSFVGNRRDMAEALAFAAEGKVKADIELQPLSAINAVFERLVKGEVPSRVVLDFGG